MGVLHVEHRVLARLLAGEFHVELDGGVVGALQEIPAGRVDADEVDEIVDRHELAGALAHLHRLAVGNEVDELHDQQLQAIWIATERLEGGAHPADVAVVVGTEHEQLAVVATVMLVAHIREIRRVIRRGAVGADHDAVLVVAALLRLQPPRAVALHEFAVALDDRQRAIQRALASALRHLVERAFAEEAVEVHAEVVERDPCALEHRVDAQGRELLV